MLFGFLQDRPLFETMDRVSNVKNLQNNLLTDFTCQTNSPLNTTEVAINSFIEIDLQYVRLQAVTLNSLDLLSQYSGTSVSQTPKSKKFISLKLCINYLRETFKNIGIINYPNRTVTTLIKQSFP